MYAKLVWFDAISGEGQVDLNGEVLYLHFTTIAGISRNNWQYPAEADQGLLGNLQSGDVCKVTVYENLYSRRVETADFAMGDL